MFYKISFLILLSTHKRKFRAKLLLFLDICKKIHIFFRKFAKTSTYLTILVYFHALALRTRAHVNVIKVCIYKITNNAYNSTFFHILFAHSE